MKIPDFHATHYVYRCFDADGSALYVGCTLDVRRRMAQHRRNKPWADLVDHVEVTTHAGRRAGFAVERDEIKRLAPIHNTLGRADVKVNPDRRTRATKDACAAGHPRTPENTRIEASGTRVCRICDRDRRRAYVAAKSTSGGVKAPLTSPAQSTAHATVAAPPLGT